MSGLRVSASTMATWRSPPGETSSSEVARRARDERRERRSSARGRWPRTTRRRWSARRARRRRPRRRARAPGGYPARRARRRARGRSVPVTRPRTGAVGTPASSASVAPHVGARRAHHDARRRASRRPARRAASSRRRASARPAAAPPRCIASTATGPAARRWPSGCGSASTSSAPPVTVARSAIWADARDEDDLPLARELGAKRERVCPASGGRRRRVRSTSSASRAASARSSSVASSVASPTAMGTEARSPSAVGAQLVAVERERTRVAVDDEGQVELAAERPVPAAHASAATAAG